MANAGAAFIPVSFVEQLREDGAGLQGTAKIRFRTRVVPGLDHSRGHLHRQLRGIGGVAQVVFPASELGAAFFGLAFLRGKSVDD